MDYRKLSVHLSYLLRHRPDNLGLQMDKHGWISMDELIRRINEAGKYRISREILEEIVAEDDKGRYRFSEDGQKIKACQGHSIPWVEPELTQSEPPAILYHGTTAQAHEKIMASGAICKMKRHAVHLQVDKENAWQSASRWHGATPVLLKIDAAQMHCDGFRFGVSDNAVWCTEEVPVRYILEVIRQI